MPSFKIAILEKDGVELDGPTEYDLAQAISEIGATDSTTPFLIPEGEVFFILDNRQALMSIPVDVLGMLQIDGALVEVQ